MVHIYCGDGKGKTTASVGLAIRMAGTGGKVVYAQFMKGNDSGEHKSLAQFSNITLLKNEKNLGFTFQMNEEQRRELTDMHNGKLAEIQKILEDGKCDLLVMDELTYPYRDHHLNRQLVDQIITQYGKKIEICITGRSPDERLVEKADYMTEMKMIKHPFTSGVGARKGVEF
ncbi:MAG: cob(I)yrinic acid a,c-diamide adenosyltransferase [Eubacteriales bacterium]